jgi:hypothetical protein
VTCTKVSPGNLSALGSLPVSERTELIVTKRSLEAYDSPNQARSEIDDANFSIFNWPYQLAAPRLILDCGL